MASPLCVSSGNGCSTDNRSYLIVKQSKKYIALDIGASNGRCVIGSFDGRKLSLETLAQFDNFYVRLMDHYYWDILGLFDKVKMSLRKVGGVDGNELASIGVDSFGVLMILLIL